MDTRKADTAVVFIDPQNDALSENEVDWGAVGASFQFLAHAMLSTDDVVERMHPMVP